MVASNSTSASMVDTSTSSRSPASASDARCPVELPGAPTANFSVPGCSATARPVHPGPSRTAPRLKAARSACSTTGSAPSADQPNQPWSGRSPRPGARASAPRADPHIRGQRRSVPDICAREPGSLPDIRGVRRPLPWPYTGPNSSPVASPRPAWPSNPNRPDPIRWPFEFLSWSPTAWRPRLRLDE